MKIVKNCASKGSTDCEDVDMTLVKSITELVIEPFTCLQSIFFFFLQSTGELPGKIKTAEVIPKNGDKHVFFKLQVNVLTSTIFKNREIVARLDKFIDR